MNKETLKLRVYYYAENIEININSVNVRKMENKWASCSMKGNLSFNKELLSKSNKIIDYVIVHELLHIRVPNHGKLWKALMMAYLGDYEKIEKQLKRSKNNKK